MNVRYDSEADAAYIRLSSNQVTRTEEESDVCILDLDANGTVVAIELLSVFGYAGASLHSLVSKGRITPSIAEDVLRDLRQERVPV